MFDRERRTIMRKIILSTVTLGALLAPLLPAAPALALNQKSYVSSAGSDANSCANVANACATFGGAITNTAAGGEVSVVGTGDYGTITINKAINITNDGAGEAGMTVGNGLTGIFIIAGVGDVVSLRGLVLDGQGVGNAGIQVNAASAVHVQNCVIRNFEFSNGGFGIGMISSGNTALFMSDTIIFNNGAKAGSSGIVIGPSGSGSANVVLDRVHVENNVIGMWVRGGSSSGGGVHLVMRDSVVSGNASHGVIADTLPGKSPAFIVLERSSVLNNGGIGLLVNGPGATVLLNDNTVIRNAVGISPQGSGQIISYGNNRVNNNVGPDGTPTGSYSPI